MSRQCGVYVARDAAGVVLYVGSAGDIDRRLKHHTHRAPWWSEMATIERHDATPRAAAYALERQMILDLQPTYNRAGLRKPKCVSRLPAGTPVVRPRIEGWVPVIDQYGSEPPLARALGVDHQTFNSVKRGRYFPSSKFIAAALTLTGLPFDDLFYVGTRDESEDAA